MHIHPDEDELYQRLLPIYQEYIRGPRGDGRLYHVFAEYWNRGNGDYSAGQAMQKTLMEFGLLPLTLEDTSSMQDGAQEYEEIMALQELLGRETSCG